jgi:hypothetical protein
MRKNEFIKGFLLLITLLNLTSCQFSNLSQRNNQPLKVNAGTSTEETEVSLKWFTDSPLKPTDTVSAFEAKAFVLNVYQTIDDNIFDPAFKQAERNQQQQDLLVAIATQPNWSRAELIERISNELNRLSVSHLRILDPVKMKHYFVSLSKSHYQIPPQLQRCQPR